MPHVGHSLSQEKENKMETEHPEPIHPANASELANIAKETGAEVLRGPLRYPTYSGGWQLGDLDLSEYLARYRDHEIVVIIASVGKAGQVEKEKYICGICGFALDELRECPRCKLSIFARHGATGFRPYGATLQHDDGRIPGEKPIDERRALGRS